MTRLQTTIRIDDWQEEPTREFDDGSKIAHALVRLVDGRDGLSSGHMESVLYYPGDGTASDVTILWLKGGADGVEAELVARGEGEFDGVVARTELRIVHGTGRWSGIKGTVQIDSTHDDYPNMPLVLDYDVP